MEKNQVNLREDLGSSIPELFERVEKHFTGAKNIAGLGLSVGAEGCTPFGGRARGEDSGDFSPRGVSVGQAVGVGSGVACGATQVIAMLDSLGVAPCRVWGARPPEGRLANGCPATRKVCGAVYPYVNTVSGSAAAELYSMKAKIWYWPLFWVDSSASFISVDSLKYQGDPVFENGRGSGPLNAPALFAASSYYGFVPGMPAFDSSVPLEAYLNNSDAGPQVFQGAFIGISIRN